MYNKCIICKRDITQPDIGFHVNLCFNKYKLERYKTLYNQIYFTIVNTYSKNVEKRNRLNVLRRHIIQLTQTIRSIVQNRKQYITYNKGKNGRDVNDGRVNRINKADMTNRKDDSKKNKLIKMKNKIQTQIDVLKNIIYNKNNSVYINQNRNHNSGSNYNDYTIHRIYTSSYPSSLSHSSSTQIVKSKQYNSYSGGNIEKRNRVNMVSNNKTIQSMIYTMRQRYIYDFAELLRGKSVAIVGPSKSIIRKRQEDYIESFDIVVRLNKSLPLPYSMKNFIGTRTDILYNNCNTSDYPGENKFDIASLLSAGVLYLRCPYPEVGVFRGDIMRFKNHNKNIGFPFGTINKKYYKSIISKTKTRPYTGTLAILDIIKHDISRLYITGLDFFKYSYYGAYRICSKEDIIRTRNGAIHKREPQIDLIRELVLTDDRIEPDDVLEQVIYEKYDKIFSTVMSRFGGIFKQFISSYTSSNTSSSKIKYNKLILIGSYMSSVEIDKINKMVSEYRKHNTNLCIITTGRDYNIDYDKERISIFNKCRFEKENRGFIKYIRRIFGNISNDGLVFVITSIFIYGYMRIHNRNEKTIRLLEIYGFDLYGKKNKNKKKMKEFIFYKYIVKKYMSLG